MLIKNKSLSRALNYYYQEQDKSISQAVKGYLNSIKNTATTTVVESLDIKEFNRSKTENRRDSNWVRGKLTEKLESVLKWYGYKVIKVDPAFTSQICPKCFNIDKNSRDFKSFKCTCCGYEDDADHNGAINIKERAKDKDLNEIIEKYKYNQKKRHEGILNYYKDKHEGYINKKPKSFKKVTQTT